MSLDELYREVIMDHYQQPRNRGELEQPDVATRGHNPLCGDEILLSVNIRDECIERIAFAGRGCSISQASASMMTEGVHGESIAEAERLASAFRAFMTQNGDASAFGKAEDLVALQGVKKFPVRIKCALLPWATLIEALALHRQRAA